MEQSPTEVLRVAYERAVANPRTVTDDEIYARIAVVCQTLSNRACARFVLATTLAKTVLPTIDIRKPYTEIGDPDVYSGRTYDEAYITAFVVQYRLPCNATTAFLTPAFRNRNTTLTPDLSMVGRPEALYRATLQLLTDIQSGMVPAFDVLVQAINLLLMMRDQQHGQLESLLTSLRQSAGAAHLASEQIVSLIQQHLKMARSSRLPVLVVAAAYTCVADRLGERVLPLAGHNAADEQTGSLGDVQVTLVADDQVITCYEMKTRRVRIDDLDHALAKVEAAKSRVDNYIFITTEPIDEDVDEYATSLYQRTAGIEFVILDCMGFLRHFLHLFHRRRVQFLDAYQNLLLSEPNSAVDHPLKAAFLTLRQVAESRNDEVDT
jgi:DNA adenine methylase